MSKQLATFVLLWSFVLLRTPVPVIGDLNSRTNCTVQDSPLRNQLRSTANCSDHEAAVTFTTYSDTQETSVDYVCTHEGGEMIMGALWNRNTTYQRRRTVNVSVQLQPGMNCTFYVCYRYWQEPTFETVYGRESPASCITDTDECATNNGGCEVNCNNTIGSFTCSCRTGYHLDEDGFNCNETNECATINGGCEQTCNNTIGSFDCSCRTGYQLDSDGFNCSEINECENANHNCHENATCTNADGSFTCSCNPGYTGDGVNCTKINECDTTNGGCEHRCIDTFGSFNCSCDIGYLLDRNGLNCSDINECDNNDDNCSENANCTNTEGSFTCYCNSGYSGDGVNCTNINECNTDNGGCDHNCTDTNGSFNCSCDIGYLLDGNGLNCVAPIEATMIAIISVVGIIAVLSAVLCVVICAVHQFRQKDTMYEISFKDDVIDLKYYPVSTDVTPKLPTVSSITSLLDRLCTVPEHISNTDAGSTSETQTVDNANELLDTVLHQTDAVLHQTDTVDVPSSNSVVTSGETTAGTAGTDCPVPTDTASVPFLVTGTGISSTPYLNEGREEVRSNLNLEMGAGTELAYCNDSDIHAVNYTPAIDLSSVISEDLLVGSHRPLCTLDDHVSESELPQSIGLETVSHDEPSFTFSAEETRNQECFQTNELQSCHGYLPNTYLLSSVEKDTDALGCQNHEGTARGDGPGIGSPPQLFSPSPQHSRTPSECSLDYFDSVMYTQLNASSLSKMQYVSASSGYITDSRAGENGPNLPSRCGDWD